MAASLLAAWRKNIFSNPFQASCDNGESAEPLLVNDERTIAAAASDGTEAEVGGDVELEKPSLEEVEIEPVVLVPEAEIEPMAVAESEPVIVAEVEPVALAEVEPVALAEVEPVALAEAEPVALAEAEPVALAEAEPVVMAEAEPVVMAEAEPVALAEAEPVAFAEAEPVALAEAEPVALAEAEPVAFAEAEPVALAEAEPVALAEAEPVAFAEAEPVALAEAEPVALAEAEPVALAEAEPVVMAEAEPVAIAEPEPIAESEPLAMAEPEAGTEAGIEPAVMAEAEPAVAAEAEPGIVTEPEITMAEPVAAAESEPVVVAEPEPVDVPKPAAVTPSLTETIAKSFVLPPTSPQTPSSEASETPKPARRMVPLTIIPCGSSVVNKLYEEHSCEFGSAKYYGLCAFGGLLSCGLTHTAVVPLDLVKCRIQVDPGKYGNIINGFRVTLAEEGVRALGKGWAPTLIGYSMQGIGKFGFYEVFKILYSDMLGEENTYLWRTSLYLAASASAEFFADIALCPMEAVKVRIQTQPGWSKTLREGFPRIMNEEGALGFYKGLVPLWARQIPYTMMKFACFERTVEALYKYVVPKPRAECTKPEQLVITFAAGYIAGVFCAIVSHPADTIVSKLNQDRGSNFVEIAKRLGFMGMWKGLFPRIIMIGTLTALQWFIYDSVKVAFRLPRPPPPEMPESLKKKMGLA